MDCDWLQDSSGMETGIGLGNLYSIQDEVSCILIVFFTQ